MLGVKMTGTTENHNAEYINCVKKKKKKNNQQPSDIWKIYIFDALNVPLQEVSAAFRKA